MKAALLALSLSASLAFAAPAAPAPSDSLYQWKAALTDDHGAPATLAVAQGRPVLVSMFYSSCPYACPLLITKMKSIFAQLPPEARAQIDVVLVSMDPARDDPAALQRLLQAHRLDPKRWHLLRPKPEDVSTIAALLGMTYRRLPDGSYTHSAEITLLAPDGTRAARLDAPADDASELVARLRVFAAPPVR